ncbi:MAG: hypothetical protein EA406_13195 [Rhodospirillales bacterium]|nr:MAG: hypothetical protein EA406_13195 [Rhodospirillales bacterium]
MTEPAAPDLTPEEVHAQLGRLMASPDFDASARNRAFLRYVVEEALAGRADRIKAYNIATSVFGRNSSFDAQLDPIVRIEAGRLRRSLERYYLSGGRTDPIRITVPKGAYVPRFEVTKSPPSAGGMPAGEASGRPAAWEARSPSILVRPFEQEGDQSAFPNFTHGFARQLIIGLTRFTDLVVFGPETSFRGGSEADLASLRRELGIDFVVTGGTTLSEDRFGVEVLLVDAVTGRYLWGESYERQLDPRIILAVRDEVANRIAGTLAQPYGIIFANRALEVEGKPPGSLTSYDYVIRFYQYRRTFDPTVNEQIREGLERAIAIDRDYAEAFACLSLAYIDAFRFNFVNATDIPHALERASVLARQAVTLAPRSSRGHHALALAYWFRNEVEPALRTFETALSLNPNDTEIMADFGVRCALRAEWAKATRLLHESFARNPAQPGTYRLGLAIDHLAHGHDEAALAEAQKIRAPDVIFSHMPIAVAAARLGRRDEAEAALAEIRRLDPSYAHRVVDDLLGRNVHPDVVQLLVDGLRLAGLPVPSTSPAVLRNHAR